MTASDRSSGRGAGATDSSGRGGKHRCLQSIEGEFPAIPEIRHAAAQDIK